MSQVDDDRKLLKRVDGFARGLTSKESDFVESCTRWLGSNRPLTDPMRKWLQDIDDKKVGG